MANKTVDEGLRPYQIGPKLRALRLKKSMGLVELGKHTGLSAALLSKLERDKLYPTLPTLLRIAMVFSVGLDYFFTDERKRHVVSVVTKDERIRLPERPGAGEVAYHFESLDFKTNERKTSAYLAGLRTHCGGKVDAAPASGIGVPARSERPTGAEGRHRPVRTGGGRFRLLRSECAAHLSAGGQAGCARR